MNAAVRVATPTAILLLAAACALAGGLSHQLGQAQGYATPIWLPAGIALGAMLVAGMQVWPGVWLGIFAITAYQLGGTLSGTAIAASAAAIATGATLQAALGAYLAQRYADPDLRFDTIPTVWRFILLCGPVAALTSATVGVTTLLVAGRITVATVWPNWLSWWVGDTLGILLGTAIVLTLLGQPRALWRPRRQTVAVPLALAMLLVLAIFSVTSWMGRQRNEAEFARHATLLASSLRTALKYAEDAPSTVVDFYRGARQVGRDDFDAFASGIYARHPAIQAVEWIPRVPQALLAAHERAAHSEGFTRYAVTEKDAGGRRQAVAPRDEYFPVQFIFPFAGNEAALGYDLGSEPIRRQAMADARRDGRVTASQRVRLVQETGYQYGVLVFAPFVRGGDDLRGFALAVIRVGQLADAALIGVPHENIAYRIDDLDAPPGEQYLHGNGTPVDAALTTTAAFEFAGRHWQFSFAPTSEYLVFQRSGYAMLIYVGTLMFASLLVAFLLILTGRSIRVEQLVAERTAEADQARKAAENASKLLHEAVGSIAQGFTIYDEQDRLVICNEAYKQFYEQSRDLIVPGATFEDIVRRGAMRGQYEKAVGRVDAWVAERVAQHQNANGEVLEQQLGDGRWLLIVEHRTPSGYIVGNRIDITDLKHATAALQDRNAQLDALFSLSPDGFVAFGADGRAKFANPAFFAMTGLAAADVVGADEAALDAILRPRVERPELFAGIASYFGADDAAPAFHLLGLQRPQRTMLQIVGIRSKAASVPRILYLRDVTRETEVDRMKSEFLSHAAHELRTPMASIFGFSELLLEMDLDPATQRDLLETIHRQTRWLVDIINELLDLARIEARRGKDFNIGTVDVAALVRETAADLAVETERWPLVLDLPAGPAAVRADPAKLRQALTNVLGNARKYSPAGGEIRVTLVAAPGKLGIAVSDHGIGMTAAQLARIGERFWRADASGKTPGTGLGMAIVKEILQLHGGTVEVRSEAGAGTTVTLWWPTPAQ